ncbi:MAG: hypothetical protein FJ395_09980 [Verrucomicrobia bacterium]|nr:hypothetical protein [Verrucomicrobiota bacterium]
MATRTHQTTIRQHPEASETCWKIMGTSGNCFSGVGRFCEAAQSFVKSPTRRVGLQRFESYRRCPNLPPPQSFEAGNKMQVSTGKRRFMGLAKGVFVGSATAWLAEQQQWMAFDSSRRVSPEAAPFSAV